MSYLKYSFIIYDLIHGYDNKISRIRVSDNSQLKLQVSDLDLHELVTVN